MFATFNIRPLQEKALEGDKKVYYAFIDLEKTYDTVPRERERDGALLSEEEEEERFAGTLIVVRKTGQSEAVPGVGSQSVPF